MKCLNCGAGIPIISAVEILNCKVASCRKGVKVVLNVDQEEVSYSVLCSQHQHKLSSVELKLFEWEELIKNRMGLHSDDEQ